MARKAILKETYRALFAKTGNQCAFPGCHHPLVDDDGDFIAQICHIEAAEEGGERFNPNMSDDERKSAANLLVLCHRHHVKTNDVEKYDVQSLKKLKAEHEKKWAERPYDVPDAAIEQIFEEEISFWVTVRETNTGWRESFDLAMDVNPSDNPIDHLDDVINDVRFIENHVDHIRKFSNELSDEARTFLEKLGYDTALYDNTKYYENPLHMPLWESLNLAFPNAINRMLISLQVLRVFLLFQALSRAPHKETLRARLDEAKDNLLRLAKSAGYVD